MLTVLIDRDRTARLGLNVADVQDTVSAALGGQEPVRCSTAIGASTFWSGCPKPARRPRRDAAPADSPAGRG